MSILLTMAVAVFIGVMSASSEPQASTSLAGSERTQEMIHKHCSERHWRNEVLITTCVHNQIDSLIALENYLERNYSDEIGDNQDHPVSIMLKDAARESSVVVDGKPWTDWSMTKYRFKRSMQDWLRANGESVAEINRAL